MSGKALEIRAAEPAGPLGPTEKPMTLLLRAVAFGALLIAVFAAMSGLYGLLILAKTGHRPPTGSRRA